MKKLSYAALALCAFVVFSADSCPSGGGGGGQPATGFNVLAIETLLSPTFGELNFPLTAGYFANDIRDFPPTTGPLTTINGATDRDGRDSQPNARFPAEWDFAYTTGDCAGTAAVNNPVFVSQGGQLVGFACIVIAGELRVTPRVYRQGVDHGTLLFVTSPSVGPSLVGTTEVIRDSYGQVVANTTFEGFGNQGYSVSLSCPAMDSLPSGTYTVVAIDGSGRTVGTGWFTVVGAELPPVPPTNTCLTGGCQGQN